jgi:hypothetical protein
MSLQDDYREEIDMIRRGYMSNTDPEQCGCGGGGWILTDFDTWEECPCHRGMMHPDDYSPEYEGEGFLKAEKIIPAEPKRILSEEERDDIPF